MSSDSEDSMAGYPKVLARQGGSMVTEIGPGLVSKKGHRVKRNEFAAMELVKKHTTVPVPTVSSWTTFRKGDDEHGSFFMEKVEGIPLDEAWDDYDDATKTRICQDIWAIVAQLQKIPKPDELSHLYQCGADGTVTIDPLIQDLKSPPTPILDDDALRARIYERYFHFGGRLYEGTLPSMLPRSDSSVFAHADLTPRNIMIAAGRITGVIDWEYSGWFPDYWEYANIMKPSRDDDWMAYMDKTKPCEWDISGIVKVRKVLF